MQITTLSKICRKIVAVGRNYAAHAAELGSKLTTEPVIFLKASSCIIEEGQLIEIPDSAKELHHEVELGLVIGSSITRGSQIDLPKSLMGFVVALDMTDRVLQTNLKSSGLPWTLAKSFDTSCPVSKIMPLSLLPADLLNKNATGSIDVWLEVNGVERQRGHTSDMLHSPTDLVRFISNRIRLEPGDLILTGTPAGVGSVHSGDVITAGIGDACRVQFRVA